MPSNYSLTQKLSLHWTTAWMLYGPPSTIWLWCSISFEIKIMISGSLFAIDNQYLNILPSALLNYFRRGMKSAHQMMRHAKEIQRPLCFQSWLPPGQNIPRIFLPCEDSQTPILVKQCIPLNLDSASCTIYNIRANNNKIQPCSMHCHGVNRTN